MKYIWYDLMKQQQSIMYFLYSPSTSPTTATDPHDASRNLSRPSSLIPRCPSLFLFLKISNYVKYSLRSFITTRGTISRLTKRKKHISFVTRTLHFNIAAATTHWDLPTDGEDESEICMLLRLNVSVPRTPTEYFYRLERTLDTFLNSKHYYYQIYLFCCKVRLVIIVI